ncbi:biotin--[acetyl-CoA-carboxylase] ligase [Marinospirillum alkaliphilum]|uniref:Bifunctional ligase/repressor BirA n=1 Tax=Marinospirillum alkaliphilum DSM 21637 TaxID=1122209 RepID=A0A1K1Z2Q1_9GAMM|nr:biotin--[acetyl-CoA-carboxylase] ligase [Marinospirillum alkaliphilum]SFX68441.1 BirA family transcriptional regulator, biotin operon repressor / biotin-[acetyl-CoA-carboxylase] ligase [Marinospirillum alkaliphilum DSM 21637]
MNLYPLIKALSDGKFHSGTELGELLGVSRTAIWKQVQQLSSWGLNYSTEKNAGYALQQPLSLLDLQQINQLLKRHASQLQAEVVPQVDSTNTELSRRIASGQLVHGTLLLAEMQTGGRGRRGRNWQSPLGSSISLSICWQFDAGANALQGLSLAIGVAVRRVLANYGLANIGLKWPNDIYAQNAKLGGILIEVFGDFAGPCQLVIGLGLNYQRTDLMNELDQPVTSLSDLNAQLPSRSQLCSDLAFAIEQVVTVFSESGFKPFKAEWNAAHIWQGQKAVIIAVNDETPVRLGGVNDLGELEVTDTDGSRRFINAGEVSVRVKRDS